MISNEEGSQASVEPRVNGYHWRSPYIKYY
jgi:hypothetical protein